MQLTDYKCIKLILSLKYQSKQMFGSLTSRYLHVVKMNLLNFFLKATLPFKSTI